MGGEKKTIGLPRWVQIIVIGRKPKWTLVRVLVIIVCAFVLVDYVVVPIRVKGISMLPTYKDGGVNFINRLSYRKREPQRGDVVGIRMAGEHIMYMKRIVGLPGEHVSFDRGKLHINGEEMDEPYVKSGCQWNMPEELLGFDMYYVVGDNRGMAMADHKQGPVPRKKIVGKVIFGGRP